MESFVTQTTARALPDAVEDKEMCVMHLWCSRAKDLEFDPLYCACALTSSIVREVSRRAFEKERRGMTALSVASELSSLIHEDELRDC